MIEQGKKVEEIESAIQHIDEKLRQGIEQVRNILRELVSRMDEVEVDSEIAHSLITPSERAATLANNLTRKLREAASPSGSQGAEGEL
jgi:hypothetical protein